MCPVFGILSRMNVFTECNNYEWQGRKRMYFGNGYTYWDNKIFVNFVKRAMSTWIPGTTTSGDPNITYVASGTRLNRQILPGLLKPHKGDRPLGTVPLVFPKLFIEQTTPCSFLLSKSTRRGASWFLEVRFGRPPSPLGVWFYAPSPEANRYPTPRRVTIHLGRSGSSSIFWRKYRICTSTVRASPK